MKRRWIRPLDVLILCALLLFTLAFFLATRGKEAGTRAQIYVNNVLQEEIPLANGQTYTVTTEKGSVRLAFSADGAWVDGSDCPDDICLRTGKITRIGQSIVCLPLGVCVTLCGAAEGGVPDGVTG